MFFEGENLTFFYAQVEYKRDRTGMTFFPGIKKGFFKTIWAGNHYFTLDPVQSKDYLKC